MAARDGRPDRPDDWHVSKEGPSGKLVAAGVALVLLLIFILQNTDRIHVDFLFWDGNVQLWVLLLIVALLGFVAGWSLSWLRARRRRADAEGSEPQP